MNLNKIYRYIILSLPLVGLVGCELTKIPEDTISPESYFQNGSQLELWTNGFYAQFDNAESVAGTNADDNIDNALGDVLMGQRSAADESGWTWTRLRDINYFLQNSYRCEDAAARKQYEGVAYFHRAYFYYVKVRRYGDVPWYDQVIKTTDAQFLYQPRDSRELVMQHIMDDLDNAIAMLPTAKDPVHVTKWTALALKSRVALFEGTFRKYRNMDGWEKYLKLAAEAAETFINESGYKLYTTGDTPYRDLFNSLTAKTEEVILTRTYSSTANVLHGVQFNITNERQGFTKRFMNHYLMADGSYYSSQANYDTKIFTDEVAGRDPRLAQTVLCPGYIQKGASTVTTNSLNALTGYQPIKYVAESQYDGSNKSYTDFPLFRTAEVYLNFAEAKAELGTISQSDINKSLYTDNKGSFNGTTKKLGTDVILTGANSGNIHALGSITVSWNEDRDYLWPIPASERVLSGGKLTQNPGWTDSTNF